MDLMKLCFENLTCLWVLDLGQKKKVGPPKLGERFSQDAPRKEMLIPKADPRVDEENVQIAMEGEMLKAIVQKKPLNLESLKGDLRADKSIFADEDGNSFQGLSQEVGFVP
jgi:hypothetical protein